MKRKGQAFETMMLVISVIVAVAILGILLGFLGNINPFGQDAKSVIKSLVKDVSNRGVGLAKQENVQFDTVPIYASEIIQDLSITSLKFECAVKGAADGEDEPKENDDRDVFCSDNPIKVGTNGKAGTKITVSKKTTGSAVVCTKEGSDYLVIIGNRGKDGLADALATAEASDFCDLT